MTLKQRIINGIKFFRTVGSKNYKHYMVKSYLPKFLDLVEDFISDGQVENQAEEVTLEFAQKLFKN